MKFYFGPDDDNAKPENTQKMDFNA